MQYYIEKYTTHTKLSALLHVKKKTTTYETTKESEAAILDHLVLLGIYSENSCLDFDHRMFQTFAYKAMMNQTIYALS